MQLESRPFSGIALTLVMGAHATLIAWLLMAAQAPTTPAKPGVVLTARLIQPAPATKMEPAPRPPVAKPLLTQTKPAPRQAAPAEPKPKPKPKPRPKPVTPPPEPVTPPQEPLPETQPTQATATDTPSSETVPAATETVSTPRFDAAYLENPAPSYPAVSRRLREEGVVLLRVLVTTDGRAGEVQIDTSSGSARLDRAAADAVQRWRFVPAHRSSVPVADWVVVPIAFTLRG